MNDQSSECNSFFCRIWRAFKSPSAKYSLGFLLIIGIAIGVILFGGFNYSMAVTNTEDFCISCHEMENFVYSEYKETNHYSNRTGVRATCPDCHVPKDFTHKMVRKIKSTNEIWHKLVGSISTPEKYEAKRLELAQRVWDDMEASDSRECRNCHNYTYMNLEKQDPMNAEIHAEGLDAGLTCIECHKGIAHKLPEGYEG